jgi:hypothetical protein
MGGSQRARRVRTRSRSGGRVITSVKEAIERAGDGSSGPRSVDCALLTAYGKPTIDFSVASVDLVSVPDPPSRVSLPLNPSREISASLPLPP